MAHRVNVTPVGEKIERSQEQQELVKDPSCGRVLPSREVKFMLFRGDDVFHFCSKECQENFIHPVRHETKVSEEEPPEAA